MITPTIITDCLGLLGVAKAGAGLATAASSSNARCWTLICNRLDGDLSDLADRLIWMPAHQTIGAIGNRHLSSGKRMSAIDWRANRLVDKLAQKEATAQSQSNAARGAAREMGVAVKHSAALLGAVTAASNNCKVTISLSDGSLKTVTRRDAQAPPQACIDDKKARLAAKAEASRLQAVPSWEESATNCLKISQASAHKTRRRLRRKPSRAAQTLDDPMASFVSYAPWGNQVIDEPTRMAEHERQGAAALLADSANALAYDCSVGASPAADTVPAPQEPPAVDEHVPFKGAATSGSPTESAPSSSTVDSRPTRVPARPSALSTHAGGSTIDATTAAEPRRAATVTFKACDSGTAATSSTSGRGHHGQFNATALSLAALLKLCALSERGADVDWPAGLDYLSALEVLDANEAIDLDAVKAWNHNDHAQQAEPAPPTIDDSRAGQGEWEAQALSDLIELHDMGLPVRWPSGLNIAVARQQLQAVLTVDATSRHSELPRRW